MQALGLVDIQQGRGVFVCQEPSVTNLLRNVSAIMLRELTQEELFAVRATIEFEVVKLAVDAGTHADLDAVVRLAKHMLDVRDPDEFLELDIQFHLSIANAAKNRLWTYMLDMVRTMVRTSMLSVPDDMEGVGREHLEIAEALAERDATAAVDAMRRHLAVHQRSARGQIVSDDRPEDADWP
jgi:GntR family transcriptional repressor for pyruvate dehydrogenase complex